MSSGQVGEGGLPGHGHWRWRVGWRVSQGVCRAWAEGSVTTSAGNSRPHLLPAKPSLLPVPRSQVSHSSFLKPRCQYARPLCPGVAQPDEKSVAGQAAVGGRERMARACS